MSCLVLAAAAADQPEWWLTDAKPADSGSTA